MTSVLSLTFLQCLKAAQDDNRHFADDFSEDVLSSIEVILKKMIENKGGKYLGITPEFSNRSIISLSDLTLSLDKSRYHYVNVNRADDNVHLDQLFNPFYFKYLHIVYEGNEIKGGHFSLTDCIAINSYTMQEDCAILHYGKGREGHLASSRLGYAVYEAVKMIIAQKDEDPPLILIPFHPLEHFWGRTNGNTNNALIEFDDWYERFRSIKAIFESLSVEFAVILGHRTWISEAPTNDELQNYCASKVLTDVLKSEVHFEDDSKESCDLCHIINVEGALNELVVTVVNWYREDTLTCSDLYYEISGPAPLIKIKEFCKKYGIEEKTENKLIEEMSDKSMTSINNNIQRSLIF